MHETALAYPQIESKFIEVFAEIYATTQKAVQFTYSKHYLHPMID